MDLYIYEYVQRSSDALQMHTVAKNTIVTVSVPGLSDNASAQRCRIRMGVGGSRGPSSAGLCSLKSPLNAADSVCSGSVGNRCSAAQAAPSV